MENIYRPRMARVEKVIGETPTIRTLVLRPEEPLRFRAGQFMQLTLPGLGEAPFTPSSSPADSERLEITILRTGTVTNAVHALKGGETVGLRGPFGKGYPVEKFAGGEVLVVGGGVGLAPLRALLYALFAQPDKYRKVVIRYGARDPTELLFSRQYDEWRRLPGVDFALTVDKPAPGWTGPVGVVTTILKDLPLDPLQAWAVSCGPEIMLKFVTLSLLGLRFPAEHVYLSMNRKMSCGLGKCGKCDVGPYYLCQDGPDMNYALIKDVPNVFG